jgi:hypothetical protein
MNEYDGILTAKIKQLEEFYQDTILQLSKNQQCDSIVATALKQHGRKQKSFIRKIGQIINTPKDTYATLNEAINDFGNTFDKIFEFEDIELLSEVNVCADGEEERDNLLFYIAFFKMYEDYSAFVNSGINLSNYDVTEKRFYDKKAELERLSGTKIKVNILRPPAEVFSSFKKSLTNLSHESAMYLINGVIKSVGGQKEYLTIVRTKRQKRNDTYSNEMIPYAKKYEEGTITNKELEEFKQKFK